MCKVLIGLHFSNWGVDGFRVREKMIIRQNIHVVVLLKFQGIYYLNDS